MQLTALALTALRTHRGGLGGAFLYCGVGYSAAFTLLMWSQPRERTAELDLTLG